MKRFFLFLFSPLWAKSQFAPAAGQPGTTAIHKDSSVIVGWAASCKITRGLQDISNNGSGYASAGDSSSAVGAADYPNVVSLGDGGIAILTFVAPIKNGTGPDFCVFENSFDPGFLELAFVEVSSDGVNYARFPATCNQQNTVQIGPFDTSNDPTKINNLAGKYVANYGVPFDLQELQGETGVDINNITHVKLIDVVGCIQQQYATKDENNNIINDLWPTAFASGGFDLDAVGVIHQQPLAVHELKSINDVGVFPSCTSGEVFIAIQQPARACISNVYGNQCYSVFLEKGQNTIDLSALVPGIYFLHIDGKKGAKKIIRN